MSAPESDTRLAVLLSGLGSTYAAVQAACDEGRCRARIVQVLSDRDGAGGLGTAKDRGIPAHALPRKDFADRTSHEAALIAAIEAAGAHWVILAGYMRILGADFVRHFQGRMLNTHPSLLPRYRGLNTYQRALDAGDSLHGCSIHFVTEDLDGGPVIARAEVPVYEGDTAAELERRTKARERKLYPLIIDMAVGGRLHMRDDRILLDGNPLTEPLRLPWDKETLE
jgi:phosphoribosylglycinamide formyltransferase 1